jgi:hypothetical protein
MLASSHRSLVSNMMDIIVVPVLQWGTRSRNLTYKRTKKHDTLIAVSSQESNMCGV